MESLKRPVIHPMGEDVLSLCDDQWYLRQQPSGDDCSASTPFDGWERVAIPRDTQARNGRLAFLRILTVPEDWLSRRVFLRFDGANCLARVYLDGALLTEHYGGFVSWDCELTGRVGGGAHRLVVVTEDRDQDVCSFHKGGLIRDVLLFALPAVCLARLHTETVFDAAYRDATLTIEMLAEGGDADVQLHLIAPDGRESELGTARCAGGADAAVKYMVFSPLKWDSEHPYLYTLRATVMSGGLVMQRLTLRFGFRQIEMRGVDLLVNGDPVKLHGVNRHDTHPLTGRTVTHELVEEDIRLFKQANINFIRTSHYTPRPDLLALCDEYGIYVEDETAVAFVGYYVPRTENDPAYAQYYLAPFAEMIERDRSHPCVILWSLANESHWGTNHALMNEYAHQVSPDRPTIFSFPMTQPDDAPTCDIWSAHYDTWDMDLSKLSECYRRGECFAAPRPVLHDESTHIPCYDTDEQRRDPGVNDFWGETIRRFFDRVWETPGALGCAIWAGVDNTELRNGVLTGPTWGVIDGWRRRKPEYWHVFQAFTPVRVLGKPEKAAGAIVIKAENRFNHTDLSEVEAIWRVGEQTGAARGEAAPPRGVGRFVLPVDIGEGEKLSVTFRDSFGVTVGAEEWTLSEQPARLPAPDLGAPALCDDGKRLCVTGEDFELVFDKESGLIQSGTAGGRPVLTGGPYLRLCGLPLPPWRLQRMDARREAGRAVVVLSGGYGAVRVRFTLHIDATGLMETTCLIADMPYPSPRRIAMTGSITSSAGGYSEVGVSFDVAPSLSTLFWEKRGLWTAYPKGHIGRNAGMAARRNPLGANLPGEKPGWGWELDERDWGLHGEYDLGLRGTRDFAAARSGILRASLLGGGAAMTVLSDGSAAVRAEALIDKHHLVFPDDARLRYTGRWLRLDNGYRTEAGYELYTRDAGASCECLFKGTGAMWYAGKDFMNGTADVYVDGEKRLSGADLGLSRMGKSPRGKQRQYGQLVFSVTGLAAGEHSLRVVATGEKAEESYSACMPVDHFVVLDGRETGDTRFHILSELNYPELSWGCYSKPPIKVATGYECRALTRLHTLQESEE